MTLPLASTIVDTCGTSPSTSWAEPFATTSEARFDIRPKPPTTGNIRAAATTLARRQHHASLMTVTAVGGRVGGCSGMVYRVTTSQNGRFCRPIAGLHSSADLPERTLCGLTARSSQNNRVFPVAKNGPDHLSWAHSAMQVTLDPHTVA